MATEGQLISAELNAGASTMEGFFTVEANGMPGAVMATIEYSGEGAPETEELIAEGPQVVRAIFESDGENMILPPTPEAGLTLHIGDAFSVGVTRHFDGMFGELEVALDQTIGGFEVIVQGAPGAMLGVEALDVRVSAEGEGWEEDVALSFVAERYIFTAEVNARAFEFDHSIEARLLGEGDRTLAMLREEGRAADETSVIDEVTFAPGMVTVRAARFEPPCDLVADSGICLGARLKDLGGETLSAVSLDEVGTIAERLFVGGSGMDAEEVIVELLDATGGVLTRIEGAPSDGNLVAAVAGRVDGEVAVDLRDTAGLRRDRAINGDTDPFTMVSVVGPIASRVASVRVRADGAAPEEGSELGFYAEWVDAEIPFSGAPAEIFVELTTPEGDVVDSAGGTVPGVMFSLSKEQRRLRIRRRIRKRISGTADRPDVMPPEPNFTVLSAELVEEGGASLIVIGRGEGEVESLTYQLEGEGIDASGTLGPAGIGRAHYTGTNPGAGNVTIGGREFPYTSDLESQAFGDDTDIIVTIDGRDDAHLDVRIEGPAAAMESIGAVPGADIVMVGDEALAYTDYDQGWFVNVPELSPAADYLGRSVRVEGVATLTEGGETPYSFVKDFGAPSVLEEVVVRADDDEFLAAVSVYLEDDMDPAGISLSVHGDEGEVVNAEAAVPVAIERVFEASVELADLNDVLLSVALSGEMGSLFEGAAIDISIGEGWRDVDMGERAISVRLDRDEGATTGTVRVSLVAEEGRVGFVASVQEVIGVDITIDQGEGPQGAVLARVGDRLGYDVVADAPGIGAMLAEETLSATVMVMVEGRGPEGGTSPIGDTPSVIMGKKFVKKFKGKTKFDRKMNESFTDN